MKSSRFLIEECPNEPKVQQRRADDDADGARKSARNRQRLAFQIRHSQTEHSLPESGASHVPNCMVDDVCHDPGKSRSPTMYRKPRQRAVISDPERNSIDKVGEKAIGDFSRHPQSIWGDSGKIKRGLFGGETPAKCVRYPPPVLAPAVESGMVGARIA